MRALEGGERGEEERGARKRVVGLDESGEGGRDAPVLSLVAQKTCGVVERDDGEPGGRKSEVAVVPGPETIWTVASPTTLGGLSCGASLYVTPKRWVWRSRAYASLSAARRTFATVNRIP